ncbi:MAG: DUF169 domain-containing protein [Thermoplasmata archaeon]
MNPPSPSWSETQSTLTEALELESVPMQLRYEDRPPAGVPTRREAAPSVCTFFADGRSRSFYADRSAHEQCEIGAYVMGIPLEGALGGRLSETVGWMESIGYLAPGEAARIPHQTTAPAGVSYGPLGASTSTPTAVLLFVAPKALMWVYEAYRRAWPQAAPIPVLGRPMCSIVPVLTAGAPLVVSTGCAGSRVYTQMKDSELLVGLRGDAVGPFVEALRTIRSANRDVTRENERRRATGAVRAP